MDIYANMPLLQRIPSQSMEDSHSTQSTQVSFVSQAESSQSTHISSVSSAPETPDIPRLSTESPRVRVISVQNSATIDVGMQDEDQADQANQVRYRLLHF